MYIINHVMTTTMILIMFCGSLIFWVFYLFLHIKFATRFKDIGHTDCKVILRIRTFIWSMLCCFYYTRKERYGANHAKSPSVYIEWTKTWISHWTLGNMHVKGPYVSMVFSIAWSWMENGYWAMTALWAILVI